METHSGRKKSYQHSIIVFITCSTALPNICVEFITKGDVDQQSSFLDARWESVMAVPQTHQVHCVQACGMDEVKVADISDEMDTSFRLY